MHRFHSTFALTCLLLGTIGCSTSVKLTRVKQDDPKTAIGVPHPLMYTRYPLTLRWQVSSCETEPDLQGKKTERLAFEPSIEMAEPTVAPDPANLFVIDPGSLSSPLKTSQLSVEYSATGGPISLNAKIEDRSAQVLAAAAGLVTGVAKFRAVPAAPKGKSMPGAEPEPISSATLEKPVACRQSVKDALSAEPDQKLKVLAASALLDAQVSDLKRLSELTNLDEKTKAELVKIQISVGSAKESLAAETKRYQRLLDKIRYDQSELWPDDSLTPAASFALPAAIVRRWAPAGLEERAASDWVLQSGTDIHVQLKGRDGLAVPKPTVVHEDQGIPIRLAVEGTLSACAGAACDSAGAPMAARHDRVLQLGMVFYLPCISRVFSSIDCSYSMDDAGRLKKMGSSASSASAETALSALGDVVKQATEARQVRNSASLKQLEADTAYLKAKAAYEAAEAATVKDPSVDVKAVTASLQTQVALLNAQRALIEADIALGQAKQKAGSGY